MTAMEVNYKLEITKEDIIKTRILEWKNEIRRMAVEHRKERVTLTVV